MASQPQPTPQPKKTEGPANHGAQARSGLGTPLGPFFDPGKFGRMFPNLQPFSPPDADLIALGRAMIETAAGAVTGDNPAIPSGFTYLGQFVDHDITFDPTTLPEVAVDPLAERNFRTPKLDLDNVYGMGPVAQPSLFDRAADGTTAPLLLLGNTRAVPDENRSLPNDLPRQGAGFAITGDPRNDENLLVAQLHVAMLKFHNKVVERLRGTVPDASLFDEARKTVTWHYQWIVLHDFLVRIVGAGKLDDILQNGRKFYRFSKEPFIPIEFSVAGYRLGHSMVRELYGYNKHFPNIDFFLLFAFTGLSGSNQPPFQMPLPSNWVIDWRRFFDLDRPVAGTPPLNLSRQIDPFLSPILGGLPHSGPDGDLAFLAVRNLLRGKRMQVPSGQDVAAAMKVTPLTPADLSSGPDGAVAQAHGFDAKTPLWFYILKEAQIQQGGKRLGEVGSTIVGEVFVGLLEGDRTSFLSAGPAWIPTLPSAQPGNFTMVDLLNFVGEVNPLGD